MNFKLSKPIKAHGQDISEIELREPTGGDCMECGMPFSLEVTNGGGQLVHIDARSVGMLISKLAGIPPSSVKELSAADFNTLASGVQSFFIPSAAAKTPEK